MRPFLLPALLVLGGLLVWRAGSRPPASPAPAASGSSFAGASQLLSGLKVGDKIDEWTVERMVIERPMADRPQLAIDLERKGSGVTVWVGRRDIPGAPIQTQRFSLSHGHVRPNGEPIPEGASAMLAEKIAERVRANEASGVELPDLK